jgi:integrase
VLTWQAELAEVMKTMTRVNGRVASFRTQDATKESVRTLFNTLHNDLNMTVQKLSTVGDRHLERVFVHWYEKRNLKPKTLQNHASRLRVVFTAIGKPHLVRPWRDYLPHVDPDLLAISFAATQSKGPTANGVDVTDIIRKADEVNKNFGLMLRLELAFGLRRREVLFCKPWSADRGQYFRVYDGEGGKGGRGRDIPIETSFPRKIIDYVKSQTGKTKRLGWEFDGNGGPTSLVKNLDRYDYYARRIGLTKRESGITPHGLRAQFAENEALRLAFVPATLGGTTSGLSAEELKLRQGWVSQSMGHLRIVITAAYWGILDSRPSADEQKRFEAVIREGIRALERLGQTQRAPELYRAHADVLRSVIEEEDGIEVTVSQAYHLWRTHSARFGEEWVEFETGVRQALEAAALHLIRQAQSQRDE